MSGIRVVVVSDRHLSGLALTNAVGRIPGTSVVAEVTAFADAKDCCERGEADAVLVDASVFVRSEFSQRQAPEVHLIDPDNQAGPSLDADRLGALTPREREVFLLLGSGLSNAHIGTLLGVSQATVKSHVGRVLAKLNLESRLQAGLAAVSQDSSQPTQNPVQN